MPENSEATRTRLLDAAGRLVEQHGFAATRVDQVVEASKRWWLGTSTPSRPTTRSRPPRGLPDVPSRPLPEPMRRQRLVLRQLVQVARAGHLQMPPSW